jgi:hypothetical protein
MISTHTYRLQSVSALILLCGTTGREERAAVATRSGRTWQCVWGFNRHTFGMCEGICRGGNLVKFDRVEYPFIVGREGYGNYSMAELGQKSCI